MSTIVLSGAVYTAIASDHISYTNKEYSHEDGGECNSYDENGVCNGWNPTYPVYDYPTRYANATVTGELNGTSNTVFVEGKAPITTADRGVETDTFSLPSSATTSGSGNHTNVSSGTLTGNGNNVYVGGNLVVVSPEGVVNTHVSGVTAKPSGATSSTVIIG